ncbi:hypothetical protein BCR33DRAFT_716320 [Rhizoclosmatium globosum]|uniref:Uncharacterized protein n=1 Tax=Rhizoclosmatium globosum TaxID=329046 RepID=A0A1Y2CFU1_9FUNG|nr:hypothetical protein BCR33DRAFT_716320 [Rhizoclosmatium globosum]|eukprot:ORY45674.1 hypothetical protein BCR33DRAFT_716320 [Rhizoclosmatium globosum]
MRLTPTLTYLVLYALQIVSSSPLSLRDVEMGPLGPGSWMEPDFSLCDCPIEYCNFNRVSGRWVNSCDIPPEQPKLSSKKIFNMAATVDQVVNVQCSETPESCICIGQGWNCTVNPGDATTCWSATCTCVDSTLCGNQ